MNGLLRLFMNSVLCIAATAGAQAAQFLIVNEDSPGVGLNDTTPAAPVGGNPGTTLGAQRLNVLQEAGNIWGVYLQSNVTIRVTVNFTEMGGDASTGFTLAGAGAETFASDFANAPLPNMWYHIALANSLAGADLATTLPDIDVSANLSLDTDPALPAWYYGLDGNVPFDKVDMLDVILHELGHGLGFSTLVNLSIGTETRGGPDIYQRFIFDNQTGLNWADMNAPQRKASATNDPHVVWSGPNTTAALGQILAKGFLVFEVTAPAGIAGTYDFAEAAYGPAVPPGGISGEVVLVDDGVPPESDACDPIINGAQLAGKIALIDRGSCNFDSKTLKAQQNGAIAVIIANNNAGEGPMLMGGNDVVDGTTLTIPSVSISKEDGDILKSGLPGVQAGVSFDPNLLAGTHGGLLRLYAPGVLELGSSISHWSTSAYPDLLMEPFINPVLREDLDLSLTLMRDIGWTVADIPYPHLSYALWAAENLDGLAALPTDDPDSDGVINAEEYFFDGNPAAPDTGNLPRFVLSAAMPELQFTRSTAPADFTFAYEVSTNLTQWADAIEGADFEVVSVDDAVAGVETITLRLLRDTASGPVFFRLRLDADL